jgi:hypothetical protein
MAVGHEYHYLECEDGRLLGAMVRGSDARAFGGAYAHVTAGPPDWTWNPNAPALPPDRIELAVTLRRGGAYSVWVRYQVPGFDADAWYGGFAENDMRRFFTPTHDAWVWTLGLFDGNPQRLRFQGLAPGQRTFVLGRGESGPRCDRVLVTSDPAFVPAIAP